jgi:transcriptional/translational regulatory protein YebC/TACO1
LATLTSTVTAPGISRELLSSELVYKPSVKAGPPEETIAAKIADLVDALEEEEDTLRVWTTLDT